MVADDLRRRKFRGIPQISKPQHTARGLELRAITVNVVSKHLVAASQRGFRSDQGAKTQAKFSFAEVS